jgi:aminoglycoside phosphotransferase (APT) family kinase protein
LTGLLRTVPGLQAAELTRPPEPITGGFWASTYLLRLAGVSPGEDKLVLRVMPDEAVAAKEAVFQRELARQEFPVPAVRLAGGPGTGLGGAFLVMDHAAGRMPLDGLDGIAALRRLPVLARDLPELLGQAAARLHALDPAPLRQALCEARVTATVTAAAMLAGLQEASAAAGRADLAAAAGWLAAHPPAPGPQAICHGDLHPFNLLVEQGRWILLDWTTALIADPAYDLAFTAMVLRHPPLTAPPPLRPMLRPLLAAAGAVVARRFLGAYRRHGGRRSDPATLTWFASLHALRILTEVDSWRHDAGTQAHAGHPFLAVASTAARSLTRATGISVQPGIGPAAGSR